MSDLKTDHSQKSETLKWTHSALNEFTRKLLKNFTKLRFSQKIKDLFTKITFKHFYIYNFFTNIFFSLKIISKIYKNKTLR